MERIQRPRFIDLAKPQRATPGGSRGVDRRGFLKVAAAMATMTGMSKEASRRISTGITPRGRSDKLLRTGRHRP
jgi:hypothetical protein